MKFILILVLLLLLQLAKGQTERYAIVVHEIMADPSPVIGLPNAEYIELKNTSKQIINLFRWKIDNGSSTATIPNNYYLEPDSMVILCSKTQALFFNLPEKTIGLTSFPAISNEGDLLTLRSSEGKTIHAVSFEPASYQDPIKSNGGWSLEMIDPSQPCSPNNWIASKHPKGGTPGFGNSVHGKINNPIPLVVQQCIASNENNLLLSFNAPLDSQSLSTPTNYQFMNKEFLVTNAKAQAPLFSSVVLTTNKNLDSNTIFTLQISQLQKCNNTENLNFTAKTGLSKPAAKDDLVFNEILFDPLPGGVDFIEIVNISTSIINAKEILFSNRNSDGTVSSNTHAFATDFNLFPLEPIVFTTDTANVQRTWKQVDATKMILVKSLPSMPDDKGNILLLNRSGVILDELNYALDMHFPLLRNRAGVALEKINTEAPSSQKDNWHSASASEGYATPTRENSQRNTMEENNKWIQVQQDVVGADNNGIDDFLQIKYLFKDAGTLLSVFLYNQQGLLVCKIINNLLCGKEGVYYWRPLDEQSNYLQSGVYILVAEAFHLNGQKLRFKKALGIKRV
jgi:hypothetical protein